MYKIFLQNIHIIYIYIYIYIYKFNSWNVDCDSGFHGVFCKTTIIRQLRRWNELKIEKCEKIDKNRWDFVYVWL